MALSQILDISAGSRFLEQTGAFARLKRGFVRLVLRGSVTVRRVKCHSHLQRCFPNRVGSSGMKKRKIIVHIATSADGYIARLDGDLDWLTSRPAPKGFYGLPKFAHSIDAKILGRTTFDLSGKMGASFSSDDVRYVFSRRPPPPSC
jgi:hypothetical protein